MVVKACIFALVFLIEAYAAHNHNAYESSQFDPDDIETVTDFVNIFSNRDTYAVAEGFNGEDYGSEDPSSHYAEESSSVYDEVPDQTLQRRAGQRLRETIVPCCSYVDEHVDVDYHEPAYPPQVGSLRGTPGVDYPNLSEIPLTSFSCAGRRDGFYADLETSCQVFHVCYPHRRESFLCPLGTVFNQPILACDYWYNVNCSASVDYFEVDQEDPVPEEIEELVSVIVDEIAETEAPEQISTEKPRPKGPVDAVPTRPPPIQPDTISAKKVISIVSKFLPVKSKVVARVTVPSPAVHKTKVSFSAAKPRVVPHFKPKPIAVPVKPLPLVKKPVAVKSAKKVLVAKTKFAAPVVKPLAMKAAVKAKTAKFAAIPAVSLITKKHLTSAILKMLHGHGNAYAQPIYGY